MTPQQRIARLQEFAAEGRIIRHEWHATSETDGSELACLLGALGRDINSPAACPADVMPAWLAHLTPALDDKTSKAAWSGIIARYADLAGRWHVLTPDAWQRCEWRVKRAALVLARPQDPTNVVAAAIDLFDRALAGDAPGPAKWVFARDEAERTAASADLSGSLYVSFNPRNVSAGAAAAAAAAALWLMPVAAHDAAGIAALSITRAAVEAARRSGIDSIASRGEALAAAEEAAWDRIAAATLDGIEMEVLRAEQAPV